MELSFNQFKTRISFQLASLVTLHSFLSQISKNEFLKNKKTSSNKLKEKKKKTWILKKIIMKIYNWAY